MKPLILIILDGWGMGQPWSGNAIFLAKTPCFSEIWQNFPHTTLAASGEAVGLSGHERGNSEAGHLNIGAGKIVHQDVNHIFHLIENGSFCKNEVLLEAIKHVKKYESNLHLLGQVSDGGIHSHIKQLFALLELCQKQGVKNIFIHAFTDGRDSEPQNALSYIYKLERKLKELGVGKIATISGRYYAMDRDNRFNRTEKSYLVITGTMSQQENQATKAISKNYSKGLTDEFIVPTVISKTPVQDNDALIFFNVRGDRARQLTRAFADSKFNNFETKKFKNLFIVTFTWYGEHIPGTQVAFKPEDVKNPLAKVLADQAFSQFHIAETEKYAHVTYFFNGGREKPFNKEERQVIPSPKVSTYDLKPEMSAKKLTEKVLSILDEKKYDFILINFANADMVGHTGNLKAGIKAIEAVDKEIQKIIKKALSLDITTLITADHGNAEQMVNPKTGEIDPEHTNNPVPFILVDSKLKSSNLQSDGILADIAPTILDILSIKKPKEMTGKNLIV